MKAKGLQLDIFLNKAMQMPHEFIRPFSNWNILIRKEPPEEMVYLSHKHILFKPI
jgi:sRNA-binding regulator protein Hfq